MRVLWVKLFVFGLVLILGAQVVGTAMAQVIETPDYILDAKWNPQGTMLLAFGRGSDKREFKAWVYDAAFKPLHVMPAELLDSSVDWNPDGTRFSVGLRIYDAQTYEVLFTIEADMSVTRWNANGSEIMAWIDGTSLGFFDATNGTLLRQLPIKKTVPNSYFVSPDDRHALRQVDDVSTLIELETGREITTLERKPFSSVAWSPDGRFIASFFTQDQDGKAVDSSLRVWNVETGELVYEDADLVRGGLILRWNPARPELVGVMQMTGVVYTWNTETWERTATVALPQTVGEFNISPSGGRLILLSMPADLIPHEEELVESPYSLRPVVGDTLYELVPAPSLDLLHSIEGVCAPPEVMLPLVKATPDSLAVYIETIRDQRTMFPGCAEELIAIATALSEGS